MRAVISAALSWTYSNEYNNNQLYLMEKNVSENSFLAPRYWLTWLGILSLRIICLLPMKFQYFLGRMLGRILHKVVKKRRHIVEINLSLCFPEKSELERKAMAVEVFENNAIGIFETAMAWWSKPERFTNICVVEGLEHIQEAKAEGHGILLTGAHYSTLDLGGFLLGQHLEFDTVYRPHNNPLFDKFICQGRSRFVGKLIDNENSRAIVKELRNGGIVWFAPDQDMGPKQSVYVPFFGVNAATVPATSKLARLGKAKVMIFGQYRLPNGGYKLTISPALDPFPTKDEETDTAQVNAMLESAIREFPTQYMWVHRRFKTHPERKGILYEKSGS